MNSSDEKNDQIKRLRDLESRHLSPRPAQRGEGGRAAPGEGSSSAELLERLKQTAINNINVFEALMDAVRACSLGQITHALFEVGGQYRRNM